MKRRSPFLVLTLTIVTVSLYSWAWLYVTKKAIRNSPRDINFLSWPLVVCPLIVLLLVPLDIFLRIQFVAQPNFLQLPLPGAALVFILIAAISVARVQMELNKLVDGAPVSTEPVASANALPPPAPQVQGTGSSWLRGIATLQPDSNLKDAALTEPPTPTPAPAATPKPPDGQETVIDLHHDKT